MKKEEILEGNRLIAEFMGKFDFTREYCRSHGLPEYNPDEDLVEIKTFKYHSSFDWLIPVVEKVEMDSALFLNISGKECNIILHSKEEIREPLFEWDETAETKIESVWKSAIEFIKYYNQQLNKQP